MKDPHKYKYLPWFLKSPNNSMLNLTYTHSKTKKLTQKRLLFARKMEM